ncbi:(S)-ureidoglycine aminohydrolase [Gordonia sp. NPDC003376]
MISSPVPIPPFTSTSRGGSAHTHYVITPANHMPSHLHGLRSTVVRKLATPRNARSRFGFYRLEIEPGGGSDGPAGRGFESFLYVVQGSPAIAVDGNDGTVLSTGGYVYVPDGCHFSVDADKAATLLWIKKRYEPIEGVGTPEVVWGSFATAERIPGSVPGIWRSEAYDPRDPAFDFAMSILYLDPGAVFPRVEIHDEEHGLYMTSGQGLYYLGDQYHEVATGDFVYMAPYCPQYFVPTGGEQAAYLLYKDVNRDGF